MSDTVIDQEHALWLDSEVTRLKRELAEARASLRAFCEGLEIDKIDLLLSVGTAGDFRALGIKMTEQIKAIRQAQAAGR